MILADQLNARLGIEARYTVQAGERRRVPRATLQALWATLTEVEEKDPAAILAALDRRDAATPLAPVVVITHKQGPIDIAFRPPVGISMLRWEIIEEAGARYRGEGHLADLVDSAPGSGSGRLTIAADLPLGYHRLELDWTGEAAGAASATLIVVPPRAWLPPAVAGGRRAWGLATQLYGLRSAANWGIGDFGDLARLIEQAAPLGAAAIGLNPLHALFPDEPGRVSPYSPSSRLFLNTAYLDVTAIADFAECEAARDLVGQPGFGAALAEARDAPLVDYPAVVALKRQVLELLYASFRRGHLDLPADDRAAAFRAFQSAGGTALRRFAVFQALSERFAAEAGAAVSWRGWPAAFHEPDGPAVAAYLAEHATRVEFFEYLQWQTELQLAGAAARSGATGMGIGLYVDLAVGFDPDGADAWAGQHYSVAGWSIGAPPDAWNMQGQNWGMPPPHPLRLRAQGYGPLIAMLRANMRHAGALRIDHILGLKRLFWIPAGEPPSAGAYVRYPFDDLLGMVALESQRNRCLVVGEDLGTVPAGFSETLQARGMLSYRLLYFTRDRASNFRRPADWPRNALAAATTHDLPTLTGYWAGRDIDVKERLSLYPTADGPAQDRAARVQAKAKLAEALAAENLPLPGDTQGDAAPTEPVLRFLGRTPCRLAMVQIDDLLDVADQVNVPGTVAQNPNWRLKLPRPIEGLLEEPVVQRRLAALAVERSKPIEAGRHAPAGPRATYRLQLNRDFTLDDAAALLPYLAALGISDVYLSPILESQPGSTHGYDVVSFDRIDPELGGEAAFERFSAELGRLGLRLLLDFVPNHMGIGPANRWWVDVLAWGPASRYAATFDIDWATPSPYLRGKILMPLLGEGYAAALAKGEIALRFDPAAGTFYVWYYDNGLPLRPQDYAGILAAPDMPASLAPLAQGFAELPSPSGPAEDALYEQVAGLQAALAAAAAADPQVKAFLEARAAAFGPQASEPARIAAFDALLQRQHWRLRGWRSAAGRINYRRFFDINQLAGLRMERPEVFARCHRLIGRLIAEGKLQGLRLDHVDGLADPAGYCRRLRRLAEREGAAKGAGGGAAPRPFYILVEKILARHETLRPDWGVDGTTGYEFANLLNGLFVDPAGEFALDRLNRDFTGETRDFDALLHEAKLQVIEDLFRGDLTRLALRLVQLAQRYWRSRDYDAERLRAALKEIAVCLPIYRTYVTPRGLSPEDRREIDGAVGCALERARKRGAESDPGIYDFLRQVMAGELAEREPAYRGGEVGELVGRLQQFTAPLMAKALEDTTFYRYARLISLNEVGGDPRAFGTGLDEFHRRLGEQRRHWPHGMLATATHDTKRGEDARTRLDVLSEMPEAWATRLARWAELNRDKRGAGETPGRGEEYLIYQTLLGAWPMALVGQAAPDGAALQDFAQRLKQYLLKALREAKQRTSWLDPDEAYEEACLGFVDRLLDRSARNPFLEDLAAFLPEIARLGALGSLSQTVLKLTAPGVPDIFQGRELWDFSLVDPDNRRPVDFAARQAMLREFAAPEGAHGGRLESRAPLDALLASWPDGAIKLRLTADLLAARRQSPLLFAEGSYEPLEVSGPAAGHVVAFARRQGRQAMIVAAGRLFARLPAAPGRFAPDAAAWRGTVVAAPSEATARFSNLFTGASAENFDLDRLFDPLPVAVLIAGEAED